MTSIKKDIKEIERNALKNKQMFLDEKLNLLTNGVFDLEKEIVLLKTRLSLVENKKKKSKNNSKVLTKDL